MTALHSLVSRCTCAKVCAFVGAATPRNALLTAMAPEYVAAFSGAVPADGDLLPGHAHHSDGRDLPGHPFGAGAVR